MYWVIFTTVSNNYNYNNTSETVILILDCHMQVLRYAVTWNQLVYYDSGSFLACYSRCHYTKSNPIDDHNNISSKKLQKQNYKPLGHYTCMQCGTSHLQTVQENIQSHIILATYRKFTVATVRFTQNVSCNIYTHTIYQQVANVTV